MLANVDDKSPRLHRIEYEQGRLRKDDLLQDPVAQFMRWYQDAKDAGHRDPSAMTLATVDKDGLPHARMVLLKTIDARGFIFCTHKDSPKGLDLQANPHAALVFYWARSERQIRVEGTVRWLSDDENAEFFSARPKGAQIAATLGHQSEAVSPDIDLEAEYQLKAAMFEDRDVPPMATWGGYAISPTMIEFWQGGVNRLHDRYRYLRTDDGWKITRLMP